MGLRAYLLAFLGVLVMIAVHAHGVVEVVPQTLIATATAGGLDVALRTVATGARVIPTGAVISGLIVALLLPEGQPWYVPLAAASIAIGSKHLLRWRGNVFNPAALGITASVLLFPDQLRSGHASYLEAAPRIHYAQAHLRMDDWSHVVEGGHGWTGSTSAIAIVTLGAVLVHRMRRIEMVAAYLATYVVLIAGFALVTGQDLVVRLVLEVFATGVLFFAFIMLTDPVTSPRTARGRAVYGVSVGVLSFVFRLIASPVLFLLLALLAANLMLSIINERSRTVLRSSGTSPPRAASRGR
jgi:Na+-translocating ferredoxin:NAD+ oxidoreductase RnfD subunit